MKRRARSRGLTLGQVLTLTFGFLAASLLIFVFGIWVGKDLVERRLAQEERVVRKVADRSEMTEEKVPAQFDVPVREEPRTPPPAAARATDTPARTATATVERRTATATGPPAAPAAERRGDWADAGWTVQVYATTDSGQATALARRLLAKGYDAYTLQAPMRGQTWYRVRVGRFETREQAKQMELRLKQLEGMEAAYLTPQ